MEGKHILLSDEGITRMTTKAKWSLSAIKEAFAAYETKVVVNYRRHFDFMVSEYNQEAKGFVGAVPDDFRIGKVAPGFCDWFRQPMNGKKGKMLAPLRKRQIEKYRSVFGSVQVFNLHETPSSNISLAPCRLCEVAPQANNTCSKATAGKLPMPEDLHESFTAIKALRIIQSAISKGWVYNVTKISSAMLSSVAAHLESVEKVDLPLDCLDEAKVDMLLKKSKQMEQMIVPEFFAGGGREALEASFAEKVERGAFCSIDLNRIFKDEY
jgi:hypothetical protein